MPICNICETGFPNRMLIDGKIRILSNRKYCLDCSPYKAHNTTDPRLTAEDKLARKRAKSVIAVSKRRKRLMDMAREYKGECCQLCGYDRCTRALEFHHIEPEKKSFSISGEGHTRSWDNLKEELDKCILLCSNCHREVEDGFVIL